jgi:hypothetical protein
MAEIFELSICRVWGFRLVPGMARICVATDIEDAV